MNKGNKKLLALILSFFIAISTFAPVFAATPKNDYESHWGHEEIQLAFNADIVKGYPDGSFKPDNAITRAEFFAIVNNTFNFNSMSEITYSDVEKDDWYASTIAKAKEAGYIVGYEDGSIQPNKNVSREETAVIISKLNVITPTSNIADYTDAASISNWSKKDIIAVQEAGIMVGYPDKSFKPKASLTRAEALAAVVKLLNHDSAVLKSVIVSPETMTLEEGGKTGNLKVKFTPSNTNNKNVSWSSSDINVVTVNNDGEVTPISEGTAIITVTSDANEMITAETILTVVKSEVVNVPKEPEDEVVVVPEAPEDEDKDDVKSIDPVNLGMAGDYAILSKTGISTVPNSKVTGNIGVSPINATGITGFALTADATNVFSTSTQVIGKVYASNYTAPTESNLTTAVSNMETAYTDAAGRTVNYTELYSGDISEKTLKPGVYKWGTSVLINSDITLDGGANDVWIFQIARGITQASNTKIILKGGAKAENIFWQTAETVSIGTGAHFEGTILSMTNIALGTNASINGRLLAQTAVTLDQNIVTAK